MKKLCLGIIGAGRIGRIHAASIMNHVPRARVAALSDVDLEPARLFAEGLGIDKVTADYKEILKDPDIDAVLICSPTNTHATIAIEAAQAGKHVFCEKPIDLSVRRIREVITAVDQAEIKMQVGFNRRFDHNFARIHDLVQAGSLGDVQILRITSRDPGPPPLSYIKGSGGMFMDMTIHDFDMAVFQVGSPVIEIFASAANLVDPAIGEAGDVDTAVIMLKFANGAIGVIDNSRKAVYGYDQRLEVFGRKGTAMAENDTSTTVQVSTADSVVTDKPLYFFLERYMASFGEEMRQFVDAVLDDQPTPITVRDALIPVLLALAAKKSTTLNRPVTIAEIEAENL